MAGGNSSQNPKKTAKKSPKPPRPPIAPRVESETTNTNDQANTTPGQGSEPPLSSAIPIANVVRVMRKALPPHAKISQESKEAMQQCLTEFISFISMEANNRSNQESRKTIRSEDILESLRKLGFDNYYEVLSRYLQRYREAEALPISHHRRPRPVQTSYEPYAGLVRPNLHGMPAGQGSGIMPQPMMPPLSPFPVGPGIPSPNEPLVRPNVSLMPKPAVMPQFDQNSGLPYASMPNFGEGSSSAPINDNLGSDGAWNPNNSDDFQWDAIEQMLAAASPSTSSAGSTSWATADNNNSVGPFDPSK